jgi:hypothetical protein
VTSLILLYSGTDEEPEDIVARLKQFSYRGIPFNIVSIRDAKLPHNWYGGTKAFYGDVFIGSYNYLEVDELIEFIRNQQWSEPAPPFQLVVLEEWDPGFRLIDIFPIS